MTADIIHLTKIWYKEFLSLVPGSPDNQLVSHPVRYWDTSDSVGCFGFQLLCNKVVIRFILEAAAQLSININGI